MTEPTAGFYNRIIFNANSAGTGNFLVLSAVTGYRTPATAGVTDEKVISYTAETADRTQWETGQGTYDVATTTVRRTTVRENSSGTTAIIDFATPPIVRLDLHAQDLTLDFVVDVRDFGFVGDNVTDDQPAIQAAIDWAFNNSRSAVRIPASNFRIKSPIWLAPPGSYASVDPQTGGTFTSFGFSMALIGGDALSSDTQYDVTCRPLRADGSAFFDYPAIIIGPGQGMRCIGIGVIGSGSLFSTTHSPFSIGFANSGGPAGASRTLVERCWVQSCYTAFKTGWNEDALADSNTWFKCSVGGGVHIGWDITEPQNYINEIISCACSAVTAVRSVVGKSVNVYGGNFSWVNGTTLDLDISSTSALSKVGDAYRFTTVITWDPGDLFGFAENAMTDGGASNPLFTAYALETESFGIIPCSFVSYVAGTDTITLQLQEDWLATYYGFNTVRDIVAVTDIEAEIQACTILMATQRITTFQGTGIHVYGAHIENPNSVTCLLDCASGFQGDIGSTLENLYFNYTPSTDITETQKKIMSVWPFIAATNGSARLAGGQYTSLLTSLPLLISARGHPVYFERVGFYNPNLYTSTDGQTFFNQVTQVTARGGFAWWDKTPYTPTDTDASAWSSTSGLGTGWVQQNRGAYPSFGYLPAPGAVPEITHAHYDLVTSAAPLVIDMGIYPVICGQTLYQVVDYYGSAVGGDEVFVRSDHDQFSWGQDFTVNWEYKGQSPCLYVDHTGFFFHGLKFGLDNGGGVEWYYCTGVYTLDSGSSPRPGYVTCLSISRSLSATAHGLAGDKATTYTGSAVYQEEYDFTAIGSAAAPGVGGREVLAVATTWYVATTGSDVTGDGTVGNPWATPNFALSEIADNYELGDEVHTLQLADGTYFVSIEKEHIGGGFLQILGNSSNVAAVVLDGTLDSHYNAAFAWQTPQDTIIAIADMTLVSNTYIIRIINRCQFRMGYINFGGDLVLGASHASVFKVNCVSTAAGSLITDRTDSITVSGNCAGYIGCDAPMQVNLGENGGTTTMSGTPAFSVGTFFASSEAEIDSYGTTFAGLATGKWWALETGAHLITFDDGTLHYIPGDTAGTLSGGAVVTYRT